MAGVDAEQTVRNCASMGKRKSRETSSDDMPVPCAVKFPMLCCDSGRRGAGVADGADAVVADNVDGAVTAVIELELVAEYQRERMVLAL